MGACSVAVAQMREAKRAHTRLVSTLAWGSFGDVGVSPHYLLQLFDAAIVAHFLQVGFEGLDARSPV